MIVPALALQVTPLVAPLVAVELKVVLVLMERVAPAGVTAVRATVWGLTVSGALAVVAPAALVTVRVKVLAEVMVPVEKAVPLVTAPTPLSTEPVPLLKVGVTVVLAP